MQRYFCNFVGNQAVLDKDDVFHLTHVMRAKVGDKIEAVHDGEVYIAVIKSLRPLEIILSRRVKENNELPNYIVLIASLIKGDKLDLVLQKATELGVSEIVLLQSERSVVKFKKDDKEIKLQRFNRILKEAAEQCRRSKIPALYQVIDVAGLKHIEADKKIIAYEEEEGPTNSLNRIVESIKPGQKVAVLIGPEGGFSENEVDVAVRWGFKRVSLGKRILRAETASFYALSVISNYLEREK